MVLSVFPAPSILVRGVLPHSFSETFTGTSSPRVHEVLLAGVPLHRILDLSVLFYGDLQSCSSPGFVIDQNTHPLSSSFTPLRPG